MQETIIRAWRGSTASRAAPRCARGSTASRRTSASTCSSGRERRARPMDLGPAREPVDRTRHAARGHVDRADPGRLVPPDGDPAEVAEARETVRLAFVAALQQLPPRQRAVLILCEVLRWKASEVAELLETSVASVNSALQRARATLDRATSRRRRAPTLDEADRELLDRYVEAFEDYDIDALTSLIHEDATQSMPPFDLWLTGREDIFTWWFGPGHRLQGLARRPGRIGERLARVRAVQAEPGRRIRALGAAGARDRGRPDRRAHVLPRHRAPVPALRPPARAGGVDGRDRPLGKRRPPPARGAAG